MATHADAGRAVVRLQYRPEMIRLSIADDGNGDPVTLSRLLRIERHALTDGRHRGLANMAVRAEKLGGSLAFRRARLGGVRIEVRIPLPIRMAAEYPGDPFHRPGVAHEQHSHRAERAADRHRADRRPRHRPARAAGDSGAGIDLRVVGEAATTETAMAVVSAVRPQIVLLDLKLSAGSDTEGLELCAALTANNPGLGVLVLTTFIDDHLVLAAIHNGARGYVVKDVDTSALIRAIRDISRGGSAFDARSAAAMVRGIHAGPAEPDKKLTAREQEVLELLSRGMSNVEIGKKLFISDTTVKFHVGNILRKLGVSRRAEAVHLAGKMGLI